MTEKHIEDSSAPLMDHLIELRSRLIWCIVAFLVAMMACFAVAQPIYEFLARPLEHALVKHGHDPKIIFTGPHKLFFTYISVSMFGGFFIAFPFIANQVWRFIAPGLYKSEQKAFLPFLVATPALFLLGAAFAYYGAMPLALDFFLSFETAPDPNGQGLHIEYLGTADEYFGLTMKFILAFGICFQLPVALTLMAKADLIGPEFLIENRKYAIIVLLIVSALVTPPDVFSMMLLFTVVYSLYEISILLVKRVDRKRREELRAAGLDDDEDEDEDAEPATPAKGAER